MCKRRMYKLFVGVVETLTLKAHNAPKPLWIALGVAVALVVAAPASADAPVVVTSVTTFEKQVVAPGAMPVATDGFKLAEEQNKCSFPITFSGDRTHTETTFDNGDKKIRINKSIIRQANGHTASETDRFEVFIDHTDPLKWKITGRFGQMFLDGKLIWLESGLLATPPQGPLTDPHPGPMGGFPNLCTILSQ